MKITRPRYYDSFRCIAGACPDSCCKDWTIVVDETAAACYSTLTGTLGDRLRQVLREEDGDVIFVNENGRCPMWRDDGLCRLQAELGEGALCDTCWEFPRLTHDYGDLVFRQLELSCPVAAKLILEGDNTPVTEELPGGEEPGYDTQTMEILLHSRQQALALLSDPTLKVNEALAVLLLYGHAVQNRLDGGDPAVLDPRADLEQAASVAGEGDMAAILGFFGELEILTDRWRKRLSAPEGSAWSEPYRALARYFVERYWLQAVADYDLVARVKLVVISCLVIWALGGDLCATAQLYSKEIENDADNIDAILDGAYEAPALTDVALLDLLLRS